MDMSIVVTMSEYGGTPDEAKRNIEDSLSRYEGKNEVFTAGSWSDIPKLQETFINHLNKLATQNFGSLS